MNDQPDSVSPAKLTDDPARARADLDRAGYCLLANALPAAALGALRQRLDEQAKAEREAGIGYFDGAPHQSWGGFRDASGRAREDAFTEVAGGVNQRLWMLVNKGRAFVELLGHAVARELVGHVLGEHYILSSFIANIANPGGVSMTLHTDQWWAPRPTRRQRRNLPVGSITRERFDQDQEPAPMIAPAACCNIMWMLDDFTADNGATRVVPGSHMSGRQPDPEKDADAPAIAACAAAGSAMVFEGRLWHGTGANRSTAPRRGLLTTFCGPQYRPQENYTIGTRPEVLRAAPPDLLALLGLRVWCGYGRRGDPMVDLVSPTETSIGEMRAAAATAATD
jgi:ectoine hydroxylase-related dioxygenase (phytanoyl-CoA dioxygenase family)